MSGNRRLDHPTLSTHPLSHITTGSTNIPLLFLPWANQRTLHLLHTMTPCLQQATLSRNYTSLFTLYLHHYIAISLFRMLEDPAFQSVVSWGPQGDCFVVKVCHSPTLQSSLSPHPHRHIQGHERIHKVYPSSNVQTLQLCFLRSSIEQVRLSQSQEHRWQPIRRTRTFTLSLSKIPS